MFSVHTTPEKFKNTTIIDRSIWICVWEKPSQGNGTIILLSSILKSHVFQKFCVHTKKAVSNFSCLLNVFEKICFCDGLVWTVGLTVEIKLRFQAFSVYIEAALISKVRVYHNHTCLIRKSNLGTELYYMLFFSFPHYNTLQKKYNLSPPTVGGATQSVVKPVIIKLQQH